MRHPFLGLISARLARGIIGSLLLLFGVWRIAFALAELVGKARDLQFWSVLDRELVSIALSIIPIVVAIALFLRRMRGFATILCLVGPVLVPVALNWFEFYPIVFGALLYWFAFILLHWPERREAAVATKERPGRPAESDWRKRLLVSLADASVERAPDRFREITLSSMALAGVSVASYFNYKVLLVSANYLPPYSSSTSFLAGWWTIFVLWVAFCCLILPQLTLRLNRLVRQARARSAEDEILQPGSRQPILYLRSFELDEYIVQHRLTLRALFAQSKATAEEILSKELRRCGPVIAVGRPGEHLPELGSARFYVSGERWRDKIADVVGVAQLVVVATGVTKGLAWEVAHLIKNLPAQRLVLWAHPHVMQLNPTDREAEWTAFLAALGKLFPKPLPQQLLETRFIHFDGNFNPIAVEARGWRWGSQQRRAFRAMLVAKGLPNPDPILRARRRQALQLAGAAAVVALLPTGGVIAHAYRIERRLRTQLRALESLAVVLASYENEKNPSEILEQHEMLLSWSQREWREHLGVPEELYDKLHGLAANYVQVFRLAHPAKIIEDLLYAVGEPLYADMIDIEEAPVRLAALTPVSAAIEAFQKDYQDIRGDAYPGFSQYLRSENELAVPALEHRTRARTDTLRAEQEVLQFLVDHPRSWTIVAAEDGGGRVPTFSDPDLQNRLVDHAERCIEAISHLSRVLKPETPETSDALSDDGQASEYPPPEPR